MLPLNEYVYGAVPPVTAPIVAVPSLNPHDELVLEESNAVGPGMFIKLGDIVNVQPLASLTIRGYAPAGMPVYAVVAVNTLPLNEYV